MVTIAKRPAPPEPANSADQPPFFARDVMLEIPGVNGMEASILDAARRCYLQYGESRMSMNDVAQLAQVSRATVYNYYSTRDDLLNKVMQIGLDLLVEDIRVAMAEHASLEDQIASAAVVVYHWSAAGRNVGLWVSAELAHPTAMVTTQSGITLSKLMGGLRPYLEVAKDRHEIRSDIDLDRASEWIARSLLSISTSPAHEDPADVQAFVRAFAVRGLS